MQWLGEERYAIATTRGWRCIESAMILKYGGFRFDIKPIIRKSLHSHSSYQNPSTYQEDRVLDDEEDSCH